MRQIKEPEPVPSVADAEEIARLKAQRDPLRAELDQIKLMKTMSYLSRGVFFLLVVLLCFYELVVYRIASRGAALKPSG